MKFLFSLLFFLTTLAGVSFGEPSSQHDSLANHSVLGTENVDVSLVSKSYSDFDRGVFAVRYKIKDDWHIYWKNPGDSGAAPKFDVPESSVKVTGWPYPKRIPVAHLVNYGYENEVLIFLKVDSFKEGAALDLEWLVCKVDCIPGFGRINLSKENVTIDPGIWAHFQSKVPKRHTKNGSVRSDGQGYIDVEIPGLETSKFSTFHLFPSDGERFSTKASDYLSDEAAPLFRIFKTANYTDVENSSEFTAVFERNDGGTFSVDFTVDFTRSSSTLFLGISLAFLGGLILNLMPCVFPVLFLKAYSFMKATNLGQMRRSAVLYSTGVVASFLILGGAVVVLNASGKSIGWGFQLQNSYFVGFLILLFLVMALSFLDVINLSSVKIPSFLQKLNQSDIGTGVLAVVVASPCTAPFMGTALGYTLTLSPLESLLIFLSLGAGLAAPVPVLSLWPRLISFLPKSGRWLVVIKKMMALPLVATSVWLSFVLYDQLYPSKDLGSWGAYDKSSVEQVRESRPVFIDFTASWCITCQVNKAAVLDTPEIQSLFDSHHVYLVRADWTDYNTEVTKALAEFGRNSIPFYVFYPKGSKSAKVLSEILTPSDIENLFEKRNVEQK